MPSTWTPDELEPVLCFRCRRSGELLYAAAPFGVVRCPACTQVFISPRLNEAGRKRLYDDAAYFEGNVYGVEKRTDLAMRLQRTWSRARLDLIERHGGPARAKRLLEVGCAWGLFLRLARERGYAVTGLEYSSSAVERVRSDLGVTVHEGHLEKAGLPDDAFDVVCFWDVLEHVPDPSSFLAAVRATAKRGAIVAFSCPYFDSIPQRVFRARWWTLRPTEHIWHFTPRTVRRLFAEAGLPIERIVRSPLARANLTRPDSLVGMARRA